MEEKCLEFYFNEDEYNEQKEQELINEIKKEERVIEVKLEVNRNEWGIYIVKANIYQRKFGTFVYENKKDNLNKKLEKGKIEQVIFTKPESIQNKEKQTKYEKYTNRPYGVYQSQGEFKPY